MRRGWFAPDARLAFNVIVTSDRGIASGSLHLDTIRDLNRINPLLATLACPVPEEEGLPARSRLRLPEPVAARTCDCQNRRLPEPPFP
ncbi:hypothetical protein [Albidovulum sp.]|uniref:hypothetical protein n=1 Tax=Albidovulum sp. TaxID=1872424 RepID=UPI0039B9C33F